ncbi:MAG: GLPGLI family protein [Polaribacter sp.]
MKIKKIILLGFILSFNFLTSQNKKQYSYKFTYKTVSALNKSDLTKKTTENMVLLANNQESIYISRTKISVDSARIKIKERQGSVYELKDVKSSLPKNKLKYVIHKNYKTKKLFILKKITIRTVQIEEKLPKFNWKIKNKTKTILGYKCQLATLNYKGRSYVTWFSKDVPLQNGPWKFGGLPGLIFEIKDLKNEYYFELIGIKKDKKYFPRLENKVIKTTNENFPKIKKNILNDFLSKFSESSKRSMKQLMKKREDRQPLNPIEVEN